MRQRQTHQLGRREFAWASVASVLGVSCSGWFSSLASAASATPEAKGKSCILLWMGGGPSQLDTFDLKPGHANGGTFRAINTTVPGIQISEHLPQVAQQMKDLAIVRSLSTKEGDHRLGRR